MSGQQEVLPLLVAARALLEAIGSSVELSLELQEAAGTWMMGYERATSQAGLSLAEAFAVLHRQEVNAQVANTALLLDVLDHQLAMEPGATGVERARAAMVGPLVDFYRDPTAAVGAIGPLVTLLGLAVMTLVRTSGQPAGHWMSKLRQALAAGADMVESARGEGL